MLRKVVKTDTTEPNCNLLAYTPDAFGIVDTLECGHVVRRKGSAGFAQRRQCRNCDSLKNGGETIYGCEGDQIRETWDEASQMPKREPVQPEQEKG